MRELRTKKCYKKALWTLDTFFCGYKDIFNSIITYFFTNSKYTLREDIEGMENDELTRRMLAPRKIEKNEREGHHHRHPVSFSTYW